MEKQIIAEFDDHLIGKPKLFIFQACRGCKSIHLFSSNNNPSYTSAQGNLRPDSSTTKSLWLSDSATEEKNQTKVDSGNYTITQVPIRRDMAIWYSTIKGFLLTKLY